MKFSRCRELLYFVARQVLDSSDTAKDAVQRCWLATSNHPPKFAYEGAFRNWLVRILIEEALAIRRTSCLDNLEFKCVGISTAETVSELQTLRPSFLRKATQARA